MALAPEQTRIGIRRHFTTEGTHPYDIHEILLAYQGLDPRYRLFT